MILGAVLAGGRSRRFGSDKALALWRDRPLIEHAIANLAPFVTTMVICGRTFGATLSIADRPRSDLGPLGGLNAALNYAQANGFARIVAVPCDAPSLPASLLKALVAVEGDAYLADMPVIGSWQSCHATALDCHVETAAGFSVRGWAAQIGAVPLHLPPPANINRPDDLQRLDG